MTFILRDVVDNIRWLGNAGFLVRGRRQIYIDPVGYAFPEDVGDIILITHGHEDHCSPQDVKWLRKGATVLVVPQSAAGVFQGDIRVVKPGDTLKHAGIQVQAVPAYNIGKSYHPREANNVGYVFTVPEGVTYYHAGDTDLIPEIKDIKADVVFLPVGGEYTMNADEAAEAVSWIKPKLAIPMHWGKVAGNKADAERFRDLVRKIPDVQVRILKAEA